MVKASHKDPTLDGGWSIITNICAVITPSISIFAVFIDGVERKRFSEGIGNGDARSRDRKTLEALRRRARRYMPL
jgi:hypothetical protein